MKNSILVQAVVLLVLMYSDNTIAQDGQDHDEPDHDYAGEYIPLPPAKKVASPQADLPSYDELPLQLRQQYDRPELATLYYHAIPEQRYALVNGFHGREGLPVGRELWIHEIRKDGVVMRIQDRYFLLKP